MSSHYDSVKSVLVLLPCKLSVVYDVTTPELTLNARLNYNLPTSLQSINLR